MSLFSHTTSSSWQREDAPPGDTLEFKQANPLERMVFLRNAHLTDKSLIAEQGTLSEALGKEGQMPW